MFGWSNVDDVNANHYHIITICPVLSFIYMVISRGLILLT